MTDQKLRTPYVEIEEVYLGALEDRLRRSRGGGCDLEGCADLRVRTPNMLHFFAWMLREREKVCDKFVWE